jgi:exonuclease III
MEDVTNLREAISVSRMREDSLFDRVSTLEAMVATLRDSTHRPSVVATHGDLNVVMNEEDMNEEKEDFIDDVKTFGNRRKKTQRSRVPNRHKARSARERLQ